MHRPVFSLLILCLLATPAARCAEPFTLNDGDRLVLIGNTLIEREQRYGYWELALTRRFADRNVIFRNLGWSGDTVWGEARAGFGSQADGFKRLKEHVLALKPTVLLVAYGGNEAFDGPAGLPRFLAGLDTLLDALAPTKARVVLISPSKHEDLGRPLPDPSAYNKNLALYRDALHETARKRNYAFVDLAEILANVKPALTENGVHFTSGGYWHSARALEAGLGFPPATWRIDVAEDGTTFVTNGVKVDQAGTKRLRFRTTSQMLPMPSLPGRPAFPAMDRVLRVQGLPVGKYTLHIDDKPVRSATAKEWANGVALDSGPEFEQSEKLRSAIVEKNRLYFHRWRPQNETYLFGFRKKEQGQNAIEIPQFDPLVAALEAEIAKLRVPTPHVFELKPE